MAGRIPQDFINDLLSRIDIVDVVDSRLALRKTGRNFQALCPFHDEKTASFSVNPEKQFYYCFGCGATGTALTFLMEHDRLEFVAAVETLASIAGVEVPREAGARGDDAQRGLLLKVLEGANAYFRTTLRNHPDAPRVVEYLKSRGLTGVIARDFGIGFAPSGWDGLKTALRDVDESDLIAAGLLVKNDQGRTYDRFRDRVMFPIRSTRGHVIGFGGRVLGNEQPKYLNSPETEVFHKSRELYGLYEARMALRRIEQLIVVEGYMDVVALAQAGFPNAVATLGTATGTYHFEKLFRHAPAVVCCFDGDAAGRDAAWKALTVALPALTAGHQLAFMFLPDNEDPDSLVRKEGKARFSERIAGAISAAEYLFQGLGRGLDLNTLDGQARLADLAMPYVQSIPDGVLRELTMERLASMAKTSSEALQRGAKLSRAPARQPRVGASARGGASGRLSERLLTILLKHPEFLAKLDDRRRARLIGIPPGRLDASEQGTSERHAGAVDSLVGEVVRYLAAAPDADLAALLGYWSGQSGHQTLVELADRTLVLNDDALAAEFDDAVTQYLLAVERANRRDSLRILKEQGSAEALAQYWQLKRKAD